MKVLILQFVDPRQTPPRPVFSQSLGTLAAMLKADGVGVCLAALGGFRMDLLKNALDSHRPDAMLIDLVPGSISAAHRTIAALGQRYRLPVIVCGKYATCRPEQAISIPGAKALLVGEYDETCVELLRAWRDGQDGAGVAGTWVHASGGLVKGDLRKLQTDLDSLPWPDRDMFDFRQHVQATGEAAFVVGRGCPRWCGHCVNDWYMDLYADAGPYTRRRSVDNVLAEVADVTGRYAGVQSVSFLDHGFAADGDWLAQFAQAYPRRCTVPYHCHVPPDLVTPELAALLRVSLCHGVTMHIGSGSRFIREEIYSIGVSNEQIIRACHTLRAAGLHVTAETFIGSPYESEITVEETLSLLRQANVDEARPKVFFPVPGTRAEELCAENGWISGRSEENFWLGHSVLDMPSMPAAHIDAVAARFEQVLRQPGSTSLRKVLDKVRNRRRGVWGLFRR